MSRGNWVQRNGRERATRGRDWVPGSVRRAFTMKRTGFSGQSRQPLRTIRQFSQPNSKPFIRKREFKRGWIPFKEGMADLPGVSMGTKLYISNLDYRIKNGDIDELFSKFGKLKRCKMHYDRTAQPSGSAEVVYERRADAIKAQRLCNDLLLGSKIMKIHIVDTNPDYFTARKNWIVGDTIQNPQRTVGRPHNFASDGPFLKHRSQRLRHSDVQSEWMQRNGHIQLQCRRQKFFDISGNESGSDFENLRVEATYF